MRPQKQTIGILAYHSESEKVLQSSLGKQFRTRMLRQYRLVLDIVKHGAVDSVVVELANGLAATPVISRIHTEHPNIPIFVYFNPALLPLGAHEIPAAMEQGALAVAVHGDRDIQDVIGSYVPLRTEPEAVSLLYQDIEVLPLPAVSSFLRYVFSNAMQPLVLSEVADALTTTPQTIEESLSALNMRSPNWFIGKARLLAAASLLEDTGRRVEDVAATLGYSSGDTLRKGLQRELGPCIQSKKRTGALEKIATHIREELSALPV